MGEYLQVIRGQLRAAIENARSKSASLRIPEIARIITDAWEKDDIRVLVQELEKQNEL